MTTLYHIPYHNNNNTDIVQTEQQPQQTYPETFYPFHDCCTNPLLSRGRGAEGPFFLMTIIPSPPKIPPPPPSNKTTSCFFFLLFFDTLLTSYPLSILDRPFFVAWTFFVHFFFFFFLFFFFFSAAGVFWLSFWCFWFLFGFFLGTWFSLRID
ncbi:hypothetical protein GE21DRAFT_6545 [Neurospora crassa]|uniref:Uncharacterized protein n=1 Tax=Neurospora crassa (strain ATCC 24698 / 74-OR23-1A / CBS 708.71 / DSM 1257 / FGSC 987) TaxID=367110 RepID=V5INY3_NEUCR|nr:hypothetical protein NCU16875 [Neurospora crassa OR74A]ESA43055.1 hypothetical protein NCU16875 [Neurospora crassa OR74A]KHE79768.1 hypothetical protein GE21DRAFT_6545 [Neurospora crassa]|eukprot:XP_011394434.1 hypothetical protein NCU16875 [Neurospora crassa OR74A]